MIYHPTDSCFRRKWNRIHKNIVKKYRKKYVLPSFRWQYRSLTQERIHSIRAKVALKLRRRTPTHNQLSHRFYVSCIFYGCLVAGLPTGNDSHLRKRWEVWVWVIFAPDPRGSSRNPRIQISSKILIKNLQRIFKNPQKYSKKNKNPQESSKIFKNLLESPKIFKESWRILKNPQKCSSGCILWNHWVIRTLCDIWPKLVVFWAKICKNGVVSLARKWTFLGTYRSWQESI